MAAQISKAIQDMMTEFDLEFSEPPEKEDINRRSKYAARFEAVKQICQRYPGKQVKMITYKNQAQSSQLAKDINNNERPEFETDPAVGAFEAFWAKIPAHLNEDDEPVSDEWGVWIKYSEADNA